MLFELGFVNLLCAGILAGEEFVTRYGDRGQSQGLTRKRISNCFRRRFAD